MIALFCLTKNWQDGHDEMRSKVQISKWQLASVTLGFLVGTSTLVTSGTVAGHDGWMSQIIAGGFGLIAALIWMRLGNLYPGKLPAEYFKIIVGKWAGTLLSLIYVWFCLHLGALVVSNVKYAYLATVFVETPGAVLVVCMMALAVYAVHLGLETFARSAEIITPLVMLFLVLITSLAFFTPGLARFNSLLPLLERGITPVIKGAFSAFAFPFGEAVVLLSFLPFVSKQQSASKHVLLPFVVTAGLLSLVAARNMAVLGESGVAQSMFPSLLSTQLIDIGTFIQRLDSLILFVWTFASFIKISACLFAAVLNLGVLLDLAQPSVLAFSMGSFVASLSEINFKNIIEMLDFAEFVWPFYAFPFQFLMPFILLIVARRKKGKSSELDGREPVKT